jgi:nicotinamide mononucleotide adenylyltransferase
LFFSEVSLTKEKGENICFILVHQNINRFSGKIIDIELFLDKTNVDILCLTETWLKPDKMSFNVENYRVASVFNRVSAMGGGCMLLIKNGFKFKERKDLVGCSVERTCEIASVELEDFLIICIYRPPSSSNFSSFLAIMEVLLEKVFLSKRAIVICGDFNIDLLSDTLEKNNFLSLLKCYDLEHLFNEPTRITQQSSTCIDNVLINNKCKVKGKCLVTDMPSDHTGQMVKFSHIQKNLKTSFNIRPLTINRSLRFKNNISLKVTTLPTADLDQDPNQLYNNLFNVVRNEYDKIYTKRKVVVQQRLVFSQWATKGIRKSRDTLYDLYNKKSYNTNPTFHEYVKSYSKLFKKVCNMAKAAFLSNKIYTAKNKIKATWNIINTETGKSSYRESTECLKLDNHIFRKHDDIANTFETFFANIATQTTQHLDSSTDRAEKFLKSNFKKEIPEFKFRNITNRDILKTFNSLNKKTTEDIWGQSVKVLEHIIEDIAPYLAAIFNNCLRVGIFPELMKHSKITPIFKSGDCCDPSNYRPISVLPALSKVFESILYSQMAFHFRSYNILHDQQFGFLKGRSTTDAGANLIKNIMEGWETSCDTLGIFCDLSKAFDCVNHQTLICKLKYYGVRGMSLNMISSYLSHRHQKVEFKDVVSQGSVVKMGVPQGSILGPFLFLIYINDLPYMVKEMCEIVLFADDTSLMFKVNRGDARASEALINSTLDKVYDWFSANSLVLNAKKTKCIKFSPPNTRNCQLEIKLDGNKLEIIKEAVFLGLSIDSNLQWDPHIINLSGKLSSAAYAVKKIRQLTDVTTARLVYYAYFHSLMSYGILLWGSAASIESIFIIQKRAVRNIYNMKPRESLRDVFKEINILTLPSLYILSNILYVRKNLHRYNKNSDFHCLNTRNKDKLQLPRYRRAKTMKSFVGNGIMFYNKLPPIVTELPESKFKNHVKQVLLRKAYYKINEYINDKDIWL